MEAKVMSLASTISSYFSVKTVRMHSAGSLPIPEKTSSYMRAIRSGVFWRPSRSGFSPMASRIIRAAWTSFSWSILALCPGRERRRQPAGLLEERDGVVPDDLPDLGIAESPPPHLEHGPRHHQRVARTPVARAVDEHLLEPVLLEDVHGALGRELRHRV